MNKRISIIFGATALVTLLMLFFIAGCGSGDTKTIGGSGEFSVTLVDDVGRSVTLDKKPERIVSLAPSNTEVLFSLGLDSEIVGVTKYCDYPEVAQSKEKVGGFSTIDIEKVVSFEPDLVLASTGNGEENIDKLEDMGIKILVLDPESVDEVLNDIEMVGKATGKIDEANELVASLNDRLDAVESKVSTVTQAEKPRILYVVWHDPLTSALPQTFVGNMIEEAGGVNIATGSSDYPVLSLESVIDQNPQVIVVNKGHGSGGDASYQYMMNEERLQGTDAAVNNRIYDIDADIVDRAGPRVVDGIEAFAECFYPDLSR